MKKAAPKLPFGFMCYSDDGQAMHLSADGPEDMGAWMSAMEKSLHKAKQKSKGSFFKKKIVPKEQKMYKNKAKDIKPAPGLLPAEAPFAVRACVYGLVGLPAGCEE